MDQRKAKREACRRASSALNTAMDTGWPSEQYEDEEEFGKASAALLDLIDELDRRGGGR